MSKGGTERSGAPLRVAQGEQVGFEPLVGPQSLALTTEQYNLAPSVTCA